MGMSDNLERNNEYYKISDVKELIKNGYLTVTEEKETDGVMHRTIAFSSQKAKEAYLENLATICIQKKDSLEAETAGQNVIKAIREKDEEGLKSAAKELFASIFSRNLPKENKHCLQLLAITVCGYINWIRYINTVSAIVQNKEDAIVAEQEGKALTIMGGVEIERRTKIAEERLKLKFGDKLQLIGKRIVKPDRFIYPPDKKDDEIKNEIDVLAKKFHYGERDLAATRSLIKDKVFAKFYEELDLQSALRLRNQLEHQLLKNKNNICNVSAIENPYEEGGKEDNAHKKSESVGNSKSDFFEDIKAALRNL
jgi:hypothetical protein